MIRSRRLLLVSVAAAILQAGFTFRTASLGTTHVPDTASYSATVSQLRTHLRFARESGRAEVMRTPGYPLILAAAPSEAWVLTVQLLARVLTVLAVYGVGAAIAGEMGGLLAAAFVALDPVSLTTAALLEPEAIFTALLFGALWLATRARSARSACLAGAAIALTAFVRPVSYYLVPVLFAWFLVRRRLAVAFCFLAVGALCLAAWQTRNVLQTGVRDFSTIAPINLYFYRAAAVVASERHIDLEQVQKEWGSAGLDTASAPTLAKWKHDAFVLLTSRPTLTVRIHILGAGRLLFGAGTATISGSLGASLAPALSVASVALLLALYAGVLLTCVLERSTLPAIVPYLMTALYLILVSAGPEAYSRFRVPMIPLFAVSAAPGISALLRKHAPAQINIMNNTLKTSGAESGSHG